MVYIVIFATFGGMYWSVILLHGLLVAVDADFARPGLGAPVAQGDGEVAGCVWQLWPRPPKRRRDEHAYQDDLLGCTILFC